MLRTLVRPSLGLLLLLLAAVSCNHSGLTLVRGVVKLDGKPLAGASVLFLAQDVDGKDARGSTDADGVFRLSTFQPNDGALPGKYKIVVQAAVPVNEGSAASPLEAQQGAPPAEGRRDRPATVPPRYSQPDQTILVQDIPAQGDVVLELQSK